MLGWLQMQAFDFAGARRIAENLLETHAEEPAGQVRTMAMLTIAYADLATGQPGKALQLFLQVRDRQSTPKFFLQWYWRMIAEFGLVGAYLDLDNLEQASAAAEQFLKMLDHGGSGFARAGVGCDGSRCYSQRRFAAGARMYGAGLCQYPESRSAFGCLASARVGGALQIAAAGFRESRAPQRRSCVQP